MSAPLTADQLVALLKLWDIKYVEVDGWRSRNRNHVGAWGPVEGVMFHHSGDDAPDSVDQKILTDGFARLPGPLCHFGMRDDGTVVLIGWGRANHAGKGSGRVLDRIKNGDHPGFPGVDNTDGNSRFYGQETMYSGNKPPTTAAYDSTVKLFAALCSAHGWKSNRCIGHREWTARKIDPGHVDLDAFRAEVQSAIESGPKTEPKPQPPPFPGRNKFGPGRVNKYVTMLGRQLVKKGYRRLYKIGPGPVWTSSDRKAVRAFQKDQGWRGTDADGLPGPETWRRLFS